VLRIASRLTLPAACQPSARVRRTPAWNHRVRRRSSPASAWSSPASYRKS